MTAFEGVKAKGRADGVPAVRAEKAKANVDYAGRRPFSFRVSRWYEKHPIAKVSWNLWWASEGEAHRQECLCH
jgi:hypothetical protein